MLHTLKLLFISSFVALFVTIALASCNDSGSTGIDQDSPPTAPDTASYKIADGEWEGALPYKNPDEDPYQSDSLYFTHFGIYKKKAAIRDSIGYVHWDNRNEYCKGTLLAHAATGDTMAVEFTNVGAQEGEECLSQDGTVVKFRHFQSDDQNWLKVFEVNATAAGRLYPKE